MNYYWNNSGTDMNSASSYSVVATGEVSDKVPGKDDLVWFSGVPEKQPHLTADLALYGIRFAGTADASKSKFYASTEDGMDGFNHSGWTIDGEPGATLTLTRTGNTGQSENNQAAINHCSYGENHIAVPLVLPDDSVKVSVSGGRLYLDGPVTLPAAKGHLYLMDASAAGSALVLAAANPELRGQVSALNCNISFAHPEALGPVSQFNLQSSTGSGKPYYVRNETGHEITNEAPFNIWMNKCEATVFVGAPMRFPNATLSPDSNQNRAVTVEESLTVGSVANRQTSAKGNVSVLDFYGAGTLHVLGSFGPNDGGAATNVLRIMGGTVVLHDPDAVESTPVAYGINGTNSRRPRLGVTTDLKVKKGLVPGGAVYWSNNCNYGGWSAYGGDVTVSFEALADGFFRLHGNRGTTDGLSAGLDLNGTDWWIAPGWMFFGSEDDDGTVTVANDIDINASDSNAAFELGAFQGGAFVAGRIAGCITNCMSGALVRPLRKDAGDGVVALDGPLHISGQHYVSAGGLLVNNEVAEGTFAVKSGAWLGGTGRVHALSVEAGGTVRPGELGGTLVSDGTRPSIYHPNGVAFADGTTLLVDIGEASGDVDVHGCLSLVGSGYPCTAAGTVTVVPSLVAELNRGRKIKILDWSGLSDPTATTLFDLENWEVDFDEEVFSKASLSIDDTALYLTFSPLFANPTMLIVK